ncbi:MAG: Rrf2 family transcriptional regulator [Planctomycetota bacterium]|nr:MAG: Rrf2 family transcriptional regulator [Planctomycetota bacterium]
MRISRSTGYALLAVGHIAKNRDQGIILSQNIAKEYDIPLEYLLKILQQLVKANILRSKKGPHGGFSLAKQPKKITLLEIVEAVEGPMISSLYLAEQSHGKKIGIRVDKISAKAIAQAKTVFEKAKLADLIRG